MNRSEIIKVANAAQSIQYYAAANKVWACLFEDGIFDKDTQIFVETSVETPEEWVLADENEVSRYYDLVSVYNSEERLCIPWPLVAVGVDKWIADNLEQVIFINRQPRPDSWWSEQALTEEQAQIVRGWVDNCIEDAFQPAHVEECCKKWIFRRENGGVVGDVVVGIQHLSPKALESLSTDVAH
jgi:hypothetical protein